MFDADGEDEHWVSGAGRELSLGFSMVLAEVDIVAKR